LPLGALLVSERVSECIHPGMHGTTFGGGPLACSVALQIVHVLEKQKLLAHAQRTGDYFIAQLQALQEKHPEIKEIRGMGLMVGMEVVSAELAKAIVEQMLKRGVIVNRTDETVIRFLPPFLIQKKHVNEVVAKLDQAITSQTRASAAAAARRSK
jgi:acetylornithine aminotransferase/acetylornithine/N-succinyldiaminopimelate aminotransferase